VTRTADGYIRVSRVAGRAGESFISPDEQRSAIEEWARSTRTTILEWHEDLDQSGGTLDRPGFTLALERCRAGLTGGIVAAKLDRLTRSVVGLASLLDDAAGHTFNVVALDLGLDLQTANGKLVANVLGSVAQWERERRRDDWTAARRNAVERGVPNGRPPFGYRKRPDGRFEINEEQAAIVRKVYERRAAGEPFSSIARDLGWSHSTTRQILSNEAYLGLARSGQFTKDGAHPPIVSREAFDAAQAGRTIQPVPSGATTRGRLLIGLARCGGCGRTLKVVRRPRADGSFVAAYFCKNAASEPCPSRAYVHADELDGFVAEWFEQALRTAPHVIDVVTAGRDLEQAQVEQAKAEGELYAYVETASALDPGLFQRGLDARQARADEARDRVRELSTRVTRLPSGGALVKLWGDFDQAERRDVLAGFVDRIEVDRGASVDLEECVRVVWSDGSLAYPAHDEERARVAAA
jgi:site-specific DNA recombinase